MSTGALRGCFVGSVLFSLDSKSACPPYKWMASDYLQMALSFWTAARTWPPGCRLPDVASSPNSLHFATLLIAPSCYLMAIKDMLTLEPHLFLQSGIAEHLCCNDPPPPPRAALATTPHFPPSDLVWGRRQLWLKVQG